MLDKPVPAGRSTGGQPTPSPDSVPTDADDDRPRRAGRTPPPQRAGPEDDGSRPTPPPPHSVPTAAGAEDDRPQRWTAMRDVADAVELRDLASAGMLASVFATADPAKRRMLTGAAYTVAAPLVFLRLTGPNARRRGHHTCAKDMDLLDDECLDRFHDDLEAVVNDLLANATEPIRSIEAWLSHRLKPVTVDAHRRRRGARGALQRPRLPRWLADALGGDPWLERLAIDILTWVGVPDTAGGSLWPLGSWAARRAAFYGEGPGDVVAVRRDVERVLAVMRRRPQWYADYVERPLGAKPVPLATTPVDRNSMFELSPLHLIKQHELDDTHLNELASLALAAIRARVASGSDMPTAVAAIIPKVFGELASAGDLAEAPLSGPDRGERLAALITDPAELARLTEALIAILADGDV